MLQTSAILSATPPKTNYPQMYFWSMQQIHHFKLATIMTCFQNPTSGGYKNNFFCYYPPELSIFVVPSIILPPLI
jgi:hypothetical protein